MEITGDLDQGDFCSAKSEGLSGVVFIPASLAPNTE
jgi:hypothetical protein